MAPTPKTLPLSGLAAVITLISAALPNQSGAAVLAGYRPFQTAAPGILAGPIDSAGSAAGVELFEAVQSGMFEAAHDIVVLRVPVLAISPASAVAEDSFFQFDLIGATNREFDLSELSFGAYNGGTTTPRGWVLRSDADGFAADIASGITTTSTSDSTAPEPFTVDLSSAAFQNLNAITFRMYAYAPTENFVVSFTGLELDGTVRSIPEPSSALLFLTTGLVAHCARRRRD